MNIQPIIPISGSQHNARTSAEPPRIIIIEMQPGEFQQCCASWQRWYAGQLSRPPDARCRASRTLSRAADPSSG